MHSTNLNFVLLVLGFMGFGCASAQKANQPASNAKNTIRETDTRSNEYDEGNREDEAFENMISALLKKKRIIPKNPIDINTVNQGGHSQFVDDVSFSPDGKYIASISRDSTIRIWEVSTGLQVKRYRIDRSSTAILSLKFLDNNHLFYYSSDESTTHIIHIFNDEWYAPPNQTEFEMVTSKRKNVAYAISKLLEPGYPYALRTIHLETHQESQRVFPKTLCNGKGRFTDYSEDTQLALFSCLDATIEVWDTKQMKVVSTLPVPRGHVADTLSSYPFKGRFVPGTNRVLTTLMRAKKPSLVSLFDFTTSNEMKALELHDTSFAEVTDVFFLSDPTNVILGVSNREEYMRHSALLLNTTTGKQVPFTTENYGTEGLALSNNGKTVAVGDAESRIRIFDTFSQQEVGRLGQAIGIFRTLSLSPRRGKLASGTTQGGLFIFDLQNLSLDRTVHFGGSHETFSTVDFSKDGTNLLSNSYIHSKNGARGIEILSLWDTFTGKLLRREELQSSGLFRTSYHRSGKFLLMSRRYEEFRFLDIDSWKELVHFSNKDLQFSAMIGDYGFVGYFSEALFNSSGELVYMSGNPNDETVLLDELTLDRDTNFAMATLDEHRVIVLHNEQFHVYDVDKKKKIQQFKLPNCKYCDEDDLFVSDDANWIGLTARPAGKCPQIQIFDLRLQKRVHELSSEGLVYDALFFNNNRYLAYSDASGAISIVNLENKQKVKMLTDGVDWVIHTEDGFFTASRNGGKLVAAVSNMHGYRIDQIAIRNNRPDIIFKRMELGEPQMIDTFYKLYLKRVKKYGVDEKQLDYVFGAAPTVKLKKRNRRGPFVDLAFAVEDPNTDILSYNIYVNDVPMYGIQGRPYDKKIIEETVLLNHGTNKIEIGAINAYGIESLRESFTETSNKKVKGDLFFVGVGISDYKKPELILKYASKDVRDLAKQFRQYKGSFKDVRVKTFLDTNVTQKSFVEAEKFLSRATVHDTVVVFIAGHGLYDVDDTLEYYFLLSNSDLEQLSQTAVNYDRIEKLLQRTAARKKLFLLDTCQSGSLDETEALFFSSQAVSNGIRSRGIKRKSYKTKNTNLSRALAGQSSRYIYNDLFRRTGAIVFSSSRGTEFSYESDAYKNGTFTEAILKSLASNSADTNKDKQVSVDEIKSFVQSAVVKSTGGLQHPVVDRDNLSMTMEFPIVSTEK